MDKAHIQQALKQAKESSSKRNFKQSVDVMINLEALDLKKQDNRVDVYAQLHFPRGKKAKICGLVGPELKEQSEKVFDTTILADNFSEYDAKKVKKLAKEHQFFVAQANIMPQVATAFGKALGPRGKMPNPKAGCVVPPNANLSALSEKLQKTVRIKIEKDPNFQAMVGKEDDKDDEIIDNIITLYNTLIHALPNEHHNIKNVCLKMTMGKTVKIGKDAQEDSEEKEASEEPAKEAPKEKSKPKAEKPKEPEAPKEEPKEEAQESQ